MQKMNGIRGAFTALCSVAALGLGGAAQAETLTDALVNAYKNSDLLEQNRALLRAADEDVAQAVAALRPVIAFIGTVSQTGTEALDFSPQTDELQSSIALSGSLTLYEGGSNRLALDAAKESVLATRASLLDVEQTILLNAVQAYLNVRSASESVALGNNNVRVITEQLRAARDRFEVGEVTRTDVSQAESRLAAAQSSLVAAQGSLAAAREAYRLTVGYYPPRRSGVPRVPGLPKSLQEATDVARQTHPDLDAAQRQVRIAELNLKRARAARLPSLTGEVTLSENTETGLGSSQVQLRMTQAIYAGGSIASRERQGLANRDAAMASLHLASRVVDQNVANAWADLSVARAQLQAALKQINAAQLAYDGTREEARLGSRTTLDVLDAEQELLNARTARVDAEAAQFLAYYQVLDAMGLLTVQHLNLGVPTYDPATYYNAVKKAPIRSVQGAKLDKVLKSLGRE